jgi:hypothetical protein
MSARHVVAVALLGTALAAGTAAAQMPVHFGLAAGASIPNGDLSDVESTGYHGMAVLDFSVPLAPVGLRIDGMFNQFSGKDIGLATKTNDFRVITANANVVLSVPGMILAHPYVIGGVGYYNDKENAGGATAANKIGYNGGVGLKLGLSGFAAFIEARYHYVPNGVYAPAGQSSKPVKFIPVTFGVMF